LGGDEQGGGAVLDYREVEGLGGVNVAEFSGSGRGPTGGVVVVAELLVAQGGRTALVSGGVNVAAAVAFLGDGNEFGWLLHGYPPRGCLVRKRWF